MDGVTSVNCAVPLGKQEAKAKTASVKAVSKAAEAKSSPVADNQSINWKSIANSILKHILFGGPTPSLCGCGEQRPVPGPMDEQLKGEGVPVGQVPGDSDTDGTSDGGTDETPIDPGDQDVTLPVDEQGDPILPDDVWYVVEGSGGRFQETPWINFEVNLGGQNLQNLDLYLEVGTDSTRISIPYDSDGDGTTDATAVVAGCFDGLINTMQLDPETLQLTPEERALYGLDGCTEDGYQSFVVCPSDAGNRLPIYISEFVIEGSTPDNTLIGQETGPAGGQQRVGVVCGGTPEANQIDIPENFYSEGTLNIKFKLRQAVDAVQADANANYQTHLRVRLKAR